MLDRLIELIQNSVNGCARHWAEIIAKYLLANGAIVPPINVGDTVYVDMFLNGASEPYTIVGIRVTKGRGKSIFQFVAWRDGEVPMFRGDSYIFFAREIGRTVFLTREAAEQAFKERGE